MSEEKQIEEMAKVICAVCAKGESPCALAESGRMCDAAWKEAEAFYNASYRKQEWISVEERLPEDKQICLAYGTVYYVPDETESEEMMITAFYKEFGFVEQVHAHITHWMPIPEAPKGGGE